MQITTKAIFIVLCLIISMSQAFAQDKKAEDQGSTIRVETDLVSIEVSVTDREGNRGAGGLRVEDFVVFENGIRQKITNFSTTDVPFNLALLIDTSGSAQSEIDLMRRAALRFLDELRLGDRVAVIQFNKNVELMEGLSTDRQKIEGALKQLKPGSGTSFYDAIKLTLDDVFKGVDGRKAVIALTDGVDSYGYTAYEQLLPDLEKGKSAFYFLELDTESFTEAGMMRDCKDRNHFEFSRKQLKKYVKEYLKGGSEDEYDNHCTLAVIERMQINRRLYQSARRELREMAKITGGRVYPVKQLQELDPAYSQIAAELRTQYSLGYYPANEKHDGTFRALRVEVKRAGYVASTKPGYRAPRD